MTATSATRAEPGGVDPLRVGVVVWLASEVMFFAGLFAAYVVLKAGNDPWPPAGAHLDVLRAALSTAVLLGSSVTMHVALRAAEAGDLARGRRFVLLTAGLGTVFVTNLVLEWLSLDFSMSSHSFGTIYYVLTGFHGLHLSAGILLLGAMARLLLAPGEERKLTALTVSSYYWHFVDAVWVVLFILVYVVS